MSRRFSLLYYRTSTSLEDGSMCRSPRKWGKLLIAIHLGVARTILLHMVQAAHNVRD